MFKVRSIVLGVLVVAGAAAVAGAQAPEAERGSRERREMRRGDRGRDLGVRAMRGLFRGIQLSDDEKARLRTVAETYRPRFQAIRQSMRPDFEAARAARQRGDTAAARAAFARTADERAQLDGLTQRLQADARAALAPGHRTQFDANVARIKERMAARRNGEGRGGWGERGKRARRAD